KPDADGTMIVDQKKPSEKCVVGIASDTGFCNIFISKFLMNRELGFGRRLFQILEEESISFEHAPSGIDDMSIIIRESQITDEKEQLILRRIHEELQPDYVQIQRDLAMVMIVGEGMMKTKGIAQKATTAFTRANVNIEVINQGSSEVSMMFGIQSKDLNQSIDRCIKPFLKIEFKKYCCTYVCTAIFLIQNQLALYSKRNLSATIAINSEFVGFAFVILTV